MNSFLGRVLGLSELVLLLLMLFLEACGGSSGGSGTSPTPVAGSSNSVATSVVADPVAQGLLLSSNVDNVVNAVSDGGTGLNRGGGGGADVTLAGTEFAESRTCSTANTTAAVSVVGANGAVWTVTKNTPFTTIARTFTGTLGNRTYALNSDGTASGDTELWYPGLYFGMLNISAAAAGDDFGNTPTSGVPTPTPTTGASSTSSGTLGSVGWFSLDGSWTGVPVWEVGAHYKGAGLAVSQTEGMVMYLTSNMPVVSAASTAPTVGGTYAPLAMVTAAKDVSSPYSVLGQFANGALPSFTSTGLAIIDGTSTSVGQAGTITTAGIPARIYNPPSVLSCGDASNVDPGYRFSQNVASLTKIAKTKTNYVATYPKGSLSVSWVGSRTVTWSDPALVTPYTSTPSSPFFDENAGTLSLTRTVQIGSQPSPNTGVSQYTPTGNSAGAQVTDLIYSSTPLVDITTRDLNNSWQWTSKTISSGVLTTTHSIGTAAASATMVTTLSNLVFTYNSVASKACTPTSGTITAVITPTDTALDVITIELKFGSSIGISSAASGVTSTTTCAKGSTASTSSPATNCTAIAEANDPTYIPHGCNF